MRNLYRSLTVSLLLRLAVLVLAVPGLAACGAGGGAATTASPPTNGSGGDATIYTGPAPGTADVQRFKINLWDALVAKNRCGTCHGAGGTSPQFVRADDINAAYQAATANVDLANPAMSRMVAKVAGGHNCWLGSPAACGDVLIRLITNWANDAQGAVNSVALVAPVLKNPGDSKSFPTDAAGFAANIHPLLTLYCARCHREDAVTPQQPFFASANVAAAYQAARSKIDLDSPANSRLVRRLRNEFHNCWSACTANATTMQNAIQTFSNSVPITHVDPQLVVSKALSIKDGIVASSGGRYDAAAIALWEFKTGSGSTAFDTSGVSPSMDLTFNGDVSWVGGYGIRVANRGRAQASTTSSGKLQRLIGATGEYSIEAWVAPGNVTQTGSARVVSYSAGTQTRNFTLGQTQYNYDFLARTSSTDVNGMPALSTADAARVLQATLQHVIVTFDPTHGRRIYVNAKLVAADNGGGATVKDWDDTFAFVLGNEVSGDRPWTGVLRFVAVHNRALTLEQIQRNFAAGVGERFYLLFSIGHLIDTPASYLLFEVEQFDSYAYLFTAPRIVVLGANPAIVSDIVLKGLRIGVNGKEPTVGQAYATLDTTLRAADYMPAGLPIAAIGAVIASDKGPADDEFFLTFERIGTNTHVRTDPSSPTPAPVADLPKQSDVGLRNFAEINASMAAATTVPANTAAVKTTYDNILQQLPAVERIDGFLASNQTAVTQLAISYCNALVETPALAGAFFPGLDLNSATSTAFAPANRHLTIDPLLQRLLGVNLGSQPDVAAVAAELNALQNRLTACGSACPANRTRTVVKASCAAVLGSAALLVQ